ncbi:outer membrane beta-barrel protein [Larkinella soli]|uniref:outer membrane beta-barrel protein n=1 Tax=Larkinella soli TaxID=1770527 RepID=UPI000FFC6F05|nr:outer membrane beta-barrel protein [Larkinella soli]
MKKVAVLVLLLGLVWNARAQGRVTVQEKRSGSEATEKEERSSDDGWGQPGPRRNSRPKTDTRSSDRRSTERVFRRIQEDEVDYAPPQKLIEMSFRFAPSVTFNTAEGFNSYTGFRENGAGMRLSLGPSLDYFFFKDRYSFSSGLWYTIHRSGYRMPGQFGQPVWDPAAKTQQSAYNLQYLQIPLSAKMYANNLFPNARLYIQTGGLVNVKLAEKALDPTHNGLFQFAEDNGRYNRQYSRFGLGLLLGTGIQYRLNQNQAFIMGIAYQRGLTDVARAKDLVSKNHIISLELGLKF